MRIYEESFGQAAGAPSHAFPERGSGAARILCRSERGRGAAVELRKGDAAEKLDCQAEREAQSHSFHFLPPGRPMFCYWVTVKLAVVKFPFGVTTDKVPDTALDGTVRSISLIVTFVTGAGFEFGKYTVAPCPACVMN
jgi:hypothetical protein